MEVALTWDLLVMIFFVIIMSYSYIVGLNGTLKIILSSYIGMLAANGIGNLISKYVVLSDPLIMVLSDDPEANIIVFKIFMFVVITLILVLRGGFIVDIGRNDSMLLRFGINSIFGFLSAGLIMSTVLVFLAGLGVETGITGNLEEILNISENTIIIFSLVKFYNVWFALPAIAFVLLSVFSGLDTPAPIVEIDE